MSTDFRELAQHHYAKYQEHEAKAADYRSKGWKEMAETEERAAASSYSAYRAAKDCC